MKLTTFLFIILMAGISLPTQAQKQGEALIDSLQTALENYDATRAELNKSDYDIKDTNKVNILNSLSGQLFKISNYLEGEKKAEEAMMISDKINFKKGKGNAYNHIGNISHNQGNYPEALKNHFAALKIRKEIGDKKEIATSYNNIAINYLKQGIYTEALINHFFALKLYEEVGYKKGIAASYLNIGNIYQRQKSYPDALKNYFASLEILEEIKEKQGMAMTYNNIGGTYISLKEYPEALKNYVAALKIREEIGDKNGIAMSYSNIGLSYSYLGSYSDAMKNYAAALKIQEEIGDKSGIAISYLRFGEIYYTLKNFPESKKYLNDAIASSKEIGVKEEIKSGYDFLAKVDSATANWKDAYLHQKLFILYRDSLVNEENTKTLTQSQMQYDFDKKESITKAEQEKKDLRQRLIMASILAGLLSLGVFSFIVFRQRNKVRVEQKRSDELLLNILPLEVAEELKQTGGSVAKQYNNVSVLFTDFVDFTGISEQLTPTDLVAEVHKNFTAFDGIIERNGLEKIKTIGDAYLAVCGLPNDAADHAQRVVKAALEIRDYVKNNKGRFQIRIGVNSGAVVAGIVGVKKYAYDIWGDTVNTANRMESSGEQGKVNISGSTYELVKTKFKCEYRGKIEAKNKGMIDMYFVEG